MILKHNSKLSSVKYCFRVMLFKMVLKQGCMEIHYIYCFRVMLFKMVLKPQKEAYLMVGFFIAKKIPSIQKGDLELGISSIVT